MFKRSFINPRISPGRLLLTIAVVVCLGCLVISLFRHSVPAVNSVVGATGLTQNSSAKRDSPLQLSGEKAREYLEQTGEGQSLMAVVTAARFGLKWQERAPFGGEGGDGYLGMSHDQNLNAWFDDEGATIRPTMPEKERAQAWQLGLRLKAYGHGAQMQAAPPIVARNVKDNRIEYERANCQLPIANCRFKNAVLADSAFGIPQSPFETFRNGQTESDELSIFQSAIGNRKSAIAEWYENRAEGIEQGFTIEARPARSGEVGRSEPLRILLGVSGDLHARTVDEGHQIELVDGRGKSALSYSKLTSQDADGKLLSARMEASADGREIALVVEDEGARYPLVIDPIVATLEQKLDAVSRRQTDARFGFAVAIDGNTAVVGAWREDIISVVDIGLVYIFSRSGNTWSLAGAPLGGGVANDNCGYSVAVSGNRVVYGCPGANSNAGSAFILDPGNFQAALTPPAGLRNAGDRYGTSVAISGDKVVVGAPFNGNGSAFVFDISSYRQQLAGADSGGQLGTSVAIDGNTILLGEPNGNVFAGGTTITGAGIVRVWQSDGTLPSFWTFKQNLFASSPASGDLFGQSVAISGNTAVVGAPLNGEKGTNAGAAYVFVRDTSGNWSQQQKLTAGDARAGDVFGASHIAIEGNTIIVGSYAWDGGTPPFILTDDDRGAVYIFTRSGTVWTQQARILANDGDRGDNFGVGIGISGNTIIVGARGATVSGTARAGAAYVYRLDCVPPYTSSATIFAGGTTSYTACPGSVVNFSAFTTSPTGTPSFQWRRNGVNIPGATFSGYSINRASASDAGSYDVVISTSCGSDTTNAVTLTVHTFNINPTSQNFGASGSTGIVNVTSTGSCGWTATSNAPWIRIDSGATGTGPSPSTVGFTVFGNTSPSQRTGTITIGDKTFTVTQDGLNCSYAIAPTSQSFTASGGTNNTVSVTTTAGCPWTATSSDQTWLTINAGASGTGNGTVSYTVAANMGPSRSGTLAVAGQTFTVTQASGCTYSLSPTAQTFPASTAAGAVNVTTSAGCAWTAINNSPSFITITSGGSGNGNGTVNYSVAANSSTSSRTGTITIAGQTFTVTQAGLSCTYSIAPSAQSFSASAGSNAVNVTTQAGCAWTANSNASFINITSGASGTGNGVVNYSVATNTSVARTGTLTIAGATFTVTQDGPQVVLTADQVTLKIWKYQGRSYAYVRLSFPDAGYRVANWGQVVRSGNDFSADASIERLTGPSVQAVTTTAQIYDLGPLTDGNYTFTFKNSGTAVKSQAFIVSSATPTPNPIDTAREFVRQQYRDFLNREADQAGEDFWTDNITKCSDPARRPAGQTEAQCTLRQRETTSGAFFLSPEFQYTGYYVLRMYQGALGRQPKLSEFLPDAQFVGTGILVNGQLSGAKINQNKADFAQQFVNCTDAARYRCGEFKGIYDGLNNQQYVDKLFQTTGVNASTSDRTALVNGLNGGSETRASVLQKVVDGIVVIAEGNQQFTTTYGQAFYIQEFNRAFVQLEYFGYMKRDPDDAGYAFWLGKLNQFNGNFVNAEMVLAFISSPEYRARFGQP